METVARDLMIGRATLVFGSGEIASAGNIRVRYTGTTVVSPDVEKASAPLATAQANRGVIITCRLAAMNAQTLAWLFGANSGQIVTDTQRNVRIVRPSASDPRVDTGVVSLIGRKQNGKEIRIFIPRASIEPGTEEIAFSKSEYTTGTISIRALDPLDGTDIPYYIEEEL
ncbi:MAG: hypothetical protein ABIK51_06005 [candidate division WOR-3 bacterium]